MSPVAPTKEIPRDLPPETVLCTWTPIRSHPSPMIFKDLHQLRSSQLSVKRRLSFIDCEARLRRESLKLMVDLTCLDEPDLVELHKTLLLNNSSCGPELPTNPGYVTVRSSKSCGSMVSNHETAHSDLQDLRLTNMLGRPLSMLPMTRPCNLPKTTDYFRPRWSLHVSLVQLSMHLTEVH